MPSVLILKALSHKTSCRKCVILFPGKRHETDTLMETTVTTLIFRIKSQKISKINTLGLDCSRVAGL